MDGDFRSAWRRQQMFESELGEAMVTSLELLDAEERTQVLLSNRQQQEEGFARCYKERRLIFTEALMVGVALLNLLFQLIFRSRGLMQSLDWALYMAYLCPFHVMLYDILDVMMDEYEGPYGLNLYRADHEEMVYLVLHSDEGLPLIVWIQDIDDPTAPPITPPQSVRRDPQPAQAQRIRSSSMPVIRQRKAKNNSLQTPTDSENQMKISETAENVEQSSTTANHKDLLLSKSQEELREEAQLFKDKTSEPGLQPSNFELQSENNDQHASINGQQPVNNEQLAINELEQVANETEMVVNEQQQLATSEPEPVAKEQQMVINEPQTVVNDSQTIVNEPQSDANEPEQVSNEPHTDANEPEQVFNEPQTVVNEPQVVNNEQQPVVNDSLPVITEQPVANDANNNRPNRLQQLPNNVPSALRHGRLTNDERVEMVETNFIEQQNQLAKLFKLNRVRFTLKLFLAITLLSFAQHSPFSGVMSVIVALYDSLSKAVFTPLLVLIIDKVALYWRSNWHSNSNKVVYYLLDVDRVKCEEMAFLRQRQGIPFLIWVRQTPAEIQQLLN